MIRKGDRVLVTVDGERVPATVEEAVTPIGNVFVKLDAPIIDRDLTLIPIWHVYRVPSDLSPLLVDEAVGGDDGTARRRRWALWYKQFELRRASDRSLYLTRWWLVDTPIGGIALHRMDGPDARLTLHDHPFNAWIVVLRGGYIERRLRPTVMRVEEQHEVRWFNRLRPGVDRHAIRGLLRVPTWTLLLIGRKQTTWGFWEPLNEPDGWEHAAGGRATEWKWTEAESYDSGSYVPLPDGTR